MIEDDNDTKQKDIKRAKRYIYCYLTQKYKELAQKKSKSEVVGAYTNVRKGSSRKKIDNMLKRFDVKITKKERNDIVNSFYLDFEKNKKNNMLNKWLEENDNKENRVFVKTIKNAVNAQVCNNGENYFEEEEQDKLLSCKGIKEAWDTRQDLQKVSDELWNIVEKLKTKIREKEKMSFSEKEIYSLLIKGCDTLVKTYEGRQKAIENTYKSIYSALQLNIIDKYGNKIKEKKEEEMPDVTPEIKNNILGDAYDVEKAEEELNEVVICQKEET